MNDSAKGCLLVVVVFIVIPYAITEGYRSYKEHSDSACLGSPSCMEQRAKDDSELTDEPIRGPSGKFYFKGDQCSSDCSGHIAGYNWADKLGLTKKEGCMESHSESFRRGCLIFVSQNPQRESPSD